MQHDTRELGLLGDVDRLDEEEVTNRRAHEPAALGRSSPDASDENRGVFLEVWIVLEVNLPLDSKCEKTPGVRRVTQWGRHRCQLLYEADVCGRSLIWIGVDRNTLVIDLNVGSDRLIRLNVEVGDIADHGHQSIGHGSGALPEVGGPRVVGGNRVETTLDLRAGRQPFVRSGQDVDRRDLPGRKGRDHDDLAR